MENRYPSVYIIVLNWNNFQDTQKCLLELAKLDYPNYKVLVIDNASSDGSGRMLQKEFVHYSFIFNDENTGYAAGNNLGIEKALRAGADYVLILNNDVIVNSPDFVDILVECLETNPQAGIIGPVVVDLDSQQTIPNCTRSRWWRIMAKLILPGRPPANPPLGEARIITTIIGCCMLIKRQVFETIGLFEDRYFMYLEEHDFCIRAAKRNFCVLYHHQVKLSRKINKAHSYSTFNQYYRARNRFYMIRNNSQGLNRMIALALHFLDLIWKIMLLLLKGKFHECGNILKGIFDGFLHVTGKVVEPSLPETKDRS